MTKERRRELERRIVERRASERKSPRFVCPVEFVEIDAERESPSTASGEAAAATQDIGMRIISEDE